MEKLIEKLMYSSRWIMAPIYLGLSLVLLALGIKFFQEILHVFPHILEMKESDLVLVTLSLIDIALVGGLIVMVMFSGYENFVSRLDVRTLQGGQGKLQCFVSGVVSGVSVEI